MTLRCVVAIGLFGCTAADEAPKDPSEKITVLDTAPLGQGEVSSLQKTVENTTVAVGVRVSDEALSSLPDSYLQNSLDLIDGVPFDHVSMDWSPFGHAPIGIWDVPHFDVHFFVIDLQTRAEVQLDDPRMEVRPDGSEIPDGYLTVPGTGENGEGTHYVDLSASEFQGAPFEAALVYGFWDGELAFIEPMVALDVLRDAKTLEGEVPWPEMWPNSGPWPTGWRVMPGEQGMEIWLEGLTEI